MKIQFLTFLTLLALISCSTNKSVDDEIDAQEESVSLEDENEYEDEENVSEDDYSQDTIEERDEAPRVTESVDVPEEETRAEKEVPVQLSGEEMLYTVEKGDTLMLIAFKLYGKYPQWKSIQNLNPELSSFENLKAGTKIKVIRPTEEFVWKPEGNPYLIKRNDTLRKISYGLYDTEKNWDHLYTHNSKLIKNPDVIFAGFTIYYLDAEQLNRDPATASATSKKQVPKDEQAVTRTAEPYEDSNPVEEVVPDQAALDEVAEASLPEEENGTLDTVDEDPEELEFEE